MIWGRNDNPKLKETLNKILATLMKTKEIALSKLHPTTDRYSFYKSPTTWEAELRGETTLEVSKPLELK